MTNLREQSAIARKELVDEARKIMKEHLADDCLNLQVLSKKLAVSERHLQRSFAEQDSQGYRWELTRMRMNAAAKLFKQDPQLSVAAVAEAVGYKQPPQFAKAFRRHANMSPKEYRSRCRLQAQ